jgi:hypothetical protein
MDAEQNVADSRQRTNEESPAELADVVRCQNPDALWRWLDRIANWEERERASLRTHPERPFLRRILLGGRDNGEWWWLSSVCSLNREWSPAHLRQLPPQLWHWPGLGGKTPELIYDFTADTLLWGDASARIDALEQSDHWFRELDAELQTRGADGY